MKKIPINEKNVEIHTALINLGRAMEQYGLFSVAEKVAEAAIEMNKLWDTVDKESLKEIEATDRALYLVKVRLRGRIADED